MENDKPEEIKEIKTVSEKRDLKEVSKEIKTDNHNIKTHRENNLRRNKKLRIVHDSKKVVGRRYAQQLVQSANISHHNNINNTVVNNENRTTSINASPDNHSSTEFEQSGKLIEHDIKVLDVKIKETENSIKTLSENGENDIDELELLNARLDFLKDKKERLIRQKSENQTEQQSDFQHSQQHFQQNSRENPERQPIYSDIANEHNNSGTSEENTSENSGKPSIKELKQRIDSIERKIIELENANKTIELDIKIIEKDIKTLENEIKISDDNSLAERLNQLEQQKEMFVRVYHQNEELIAKLKEEKSALEKTLKETVSASKKSGKIVRSILTAPLKIGINATKSVVSAVNPLNKKIDKSDITDTGTESVKLANTAVKTGKNTIKTVKNGIKTTRRTIKGTVKTVKTTGKVVYHTTKFAVKAVTVVGKVAINVSSNVIAFLMNPVVLILVLFIIIVINVMSFIVVALGGSAAAVTSNEQATMQAVGLKDIVGQYHNGQDYLSNAINDSRNDFYSMIDNMYYDYDDLTHSDLAYMECFKPGFTQTYNTGFANDEWKNTLKSAWDIEFNEQEIISIAYIYLEKQKNEENGTNQQIYEVTFTQDVFNTIISEYVKTSDTVYENQECPGGQCTRHVEYVENPYYTSAYENREYWVKAYNAWVDEVLTDNMSIDYWSYIYNRNPYDDIQNFESYLYKDYLYENFLNADDIFQNTPEQFEEVSYICEHQHKLHSIGLAFFSKEDVMNSLGFNDNYKKWEVMIEHGFETNPDI